ncbi:MAG: S26 family signal peptidase [Candidatus Micrarchaeaceae archaeon]
MKPLLPIRVFRAAGRSMEPAVKDGDYLVLCTFCRKFRVGDIVVLKHPENGMEIVKRVERIDKGMIFVLGDNRDYSEDSRKFGEVPMTDVVGRMILRI